MNGCMLIFGHGYSAQALSARLLAKGWRVVATTRSADTAARPDRNSIERVQWPGTDMRPHLERATHILHSIPPNADGDPILNGLRDEIADAAPFAWTGYLSTTGVYGNHDGGWVDEDTDLNPSTKRGHYRVAAEAAWQKLAAQFELNLHIFRLAGIYGPGRGPFNKVRNGTARRIVKPGQVFSRIHVEDIAQTLEASIGRPNPGAIYNVCDDEAAPPEDVLGYAADLLDLPIPPAEDWETAELSPMARSFYSESKRVRNNRIKAELGVSLRYPNYRTGLASMLKDEAD